MALTNIQNEFLKLQLANNPEFRAEYFPNVITEGPTGPLYNVDPAYRIKRSRPANVFYEGDPESDKAAEFRDINVPYDTPGSRLNIKDIVPSPYEWAPRRKRMEYAHMKPYELYHEGQPVHGGQTQAINVNPDILASYGTATSSPRNEMVNTPEWYKQAAADFGGIEINPTVDQAELNEFIVSMLGHEVGHGVADLPPYAQESETAETFDMSEFVPDEFIDVGPAKTIPFPLPKDDSYIPSGSELYNRMRDIERLKIENPDDYENHPLWELYQNRAKMNFANLTNQTSKYPLNFRTYQKKIQPFVDKYFQKVTAPESVAAFQAAGAYSPRVQQDPGGGGTWHAQTAAKEAAGQQVAGPGFGRGAYFSEGGLATMFERR